MGRGRASSKAAVDKEITLIREARMTRIAKLQGFNGITPSPYGLSERRREGMLHYYEGPRDMGRFIPVYYDMGFLEHLWGVRFDVGRLYEEDFIITSNPKADGFTYFRNEKPLPNGLKNFRREELSDRV